MFTVCNLPPVVIVNSVLSNSIGIKKRMSHTARFNLWPIQPGLTFGPYNQLYPLAHITRFNLSLDVVRHFLPLIDTGFCLRSFVTMIIYICLS